MGLVNLFSGQQWRNRHREQTYGHGVGVGEEGEGESMKRVTWKLTIAAQGTEVFKGVFQGCVGGGRGQDGTVSSDSHLDISDVVVWPASSLVVLSTVKL